MTYNEFKAKALNALKDTTDNARFETDAIIMHFSGFKKNELILNRASTIQDDVLENLENALKRRIDHEPLQYIIGEWEFFGLRIFCGDGCLIPRPETEMLSEIAIKQLPRNGRFLDLCTGSGCITVAILNNRPDVTAVALDISPKALEYARKNAQYHGISQSRLTLLNCDLYDYVPNEDFDMIISNPPYIKSADIPKLSKEVLHEPVLALDGGHDGLDLYKVIARNIASRCLKENGLCAVEVGYDIPKEVAAIFKAQKFDAKILRDSFEVERVCIAKHSKI